MPEINEQVRRELQASTAERREAHDREVQKALTALRESLRDKAEAAKQQKPQK